MSTTRRPDLLSIVSVVALLGLSASHYLWQGDDVTHAVIRRLVYLPIALLAVRWGGRVGATGGVVAALLYAPHAFFPHAFHFAGVMIHEDPSPLVEKVSDVLLYVTLGTLVGFAKDFLRQSQERLVQVQQTLTTTTEALRRAERLGALGELTAGIAHEVRNPLTALKTTGEMLAEAYPEGHRRHKMALLHLRELDRLDGVVEKFLKFARPTPPHIGPHAVDSLFHQASDLLRATANDSEVALEIHGCGETIDVDEDLTVQALLNLGLNAVQHSPKGGVVSFRCDIAETTLRLIVEDQGPGVRVDLEGRIFDPCVTTRAEGSGLGLSIASRAMESQGGHLSYEKARTGGACFVITLSRETA